MWLPLARPQLGTWPEIQACALTGNRTGDCLVCRLALDPLSHTSQGRIFISHSAQVMLMLLEQGPHWKQPDFRFFYVPAKKCAPL